ncbi:MAG: LamG domain-containing protein, partial [Planctomycetota bacterium]
MKSHRRQLFPRLIVVLFAIGPVVHSYGQPVLHYGFDRNNYDNRDARDVGTPPAADGIFTGDAIRMADPPANFSCAALDLTPNGAINNYVITGADVNKIDALTEMTVAMWVNLQANPDNEDSLVSKVPQGFPVPPVGVGGWALWIGEVGGNPPTASNFSLNFGIYKSLGTYWQIQGSYSPAVNADHKWVFLAITYDATKRQRFYVGDENTVVSQIGLTQIYTYDLLDNSSEFRVGSDGFYPGTDYTPPAWIDDVRIYDSALSAAELDQVRL